MFNPVNLGVVRRLAQYNRALRCKWPAVAAWNCTTCRTAFAPGSTHLLASYLTTAYAPGFDPERGITITSQDKVGAVWRPALLRPLWLLRAALHCPPAGCIASRPGCRQRLHAAGVAGQRQAGGRQARAPQQQQPQPEPQPLP